MGEMVLLLLQLQVIGIVQICCEVCGEVRWKYSSTNDKAVMVVSVFHHPLPPQSAQKWYNTILHMYQIKLPLQFIYKNN